MKQYSCGNTAGMSEVIKPPSAVVKGGMRAVKNVSAAVST
jgi:hypothetical protein